MEQNIIDATEYILMAINKITTIEDFMDYKEEIIKALMDIRNTFNIIIKNKSNTYQLKPNNKDMKTKEKKEDKIENSKNFNSNTNNTNNLRILNINEKIEKSQKIDTKEEITKETKAPSISSVLGLKFNYDEYLKEIDLQNLTENHTTNPITDNKELQNIIHKNNNIIPNNNNETFNIINNINNNSKMNTNNSNNVNNINCTNNNILGVQIQDSNNDDNSEPIPLNFLENYENICCNKSLRNKGAFTNIQKPNSNLVNNHVKNYEKNISENFIINNDKKSKTSNCFHSKKEKISMIADIIMLMNNDDYIYEILTKLFGNDLADKLMSSMVEDDLLQSVNKAIKEIQRLKEKDKIQSKNSEINNISYQKINIKTDPNFYVGKTTKNQNNDKSDPYQEFNFKKSLRNNNYNDFKRSNSRSNGSKGKNDSKNNIHSFLLDINKKDKPFITATSAYGKYFDESLQKGGFTKLPVGNKSQRQFYSAKKLNDKNSSVEH